MSSSRTRRVAVVPLGEDTGPLDGSQSSRSSLAAAPRAAGPGGAHGARVFGPWGLRELVFAGAALGVALCSFLYFGRLAEPGRYWSVALAVLPLLAAARMLLASAVPAVNRRLAGLEADQWATAVSLNALVFSLVEASRDMGALIAATVLFAAGMTSATACARFVPAFSAGRAVSRQASSPAPTPLQTTTAQQSVPPGGETRAIPVPERRSASRPFWFAVPSRREVRDPRSGVVVGYAEPGVWILAREDRGTSFLVELESGRRGLLADVTGIERA